MAKKIIDPKRSKIARGAKQKGSRAQREVAKILGLHYFNDSDIFHSTPSSGGLRWKSKVAGTRGDIVPADHIDWPYSIEIKNQEKSNWDFYSLLLNQGPILKSWWAQCLEDSQVTNKIPWLIFTRNGLPYFSMLKISSFNDSTYIKFLPDNHFLLTLNLEKSLIISTLGHLLMANNHLKYQAEDHEVSLQKLMNKIVFNPVNKSLK